MADITPFLSFIRNGVLASKAVMGNTIMGFRGCKITLHGTYQGHSMGQSPKHRLFWLYANNSQWLVVNGADKTITTSGGAVTGNTSFSFAGLKATVEWT